jgi:hypothetical protein
MNNCRINDVSCLPNFPLISLIGGLYYGMLRDLILVYYVFYGVKHAEAAPRQRQQHRRRRGLEHAGGEAFPPAYERPGAGTVLSKAGAARRGARRIAATSIPRKHKQQGVFAALLANSGDANIALSGNSAIVRL